MMTAWQSLKKNSDTLEGEVRQPLAERFFEETALPDQDPDNNFNYRVRDPETGLTISAPYQIFYFEIDESYDGPYYDYKIETTTEKVKVDGVDREAKVQTLKVTKNPDKDFSMGENEFIHLCARTTLGYTRSQKFDIIKQVEEQRELIEAGLTPQEALALDEAEFDTVDTTATTAEEAKQQAYLDSLTGEQATPPAEPDEVQYGGKKVKWPWEMLKKSPKHYNMEVISGFGGFTTTATSMLKMLPKSGDKSTDLVAHHETTIRTTLTLCLLPIQVEHTTPTLALEQSHSLKSSTDPFVGQVTS